MTSAYELWTAERGAEIIAEHSHVEGGTLVVLHALQQTFGYVPEPAIPMVALALNLSRAEVHGVFTFYHDYRHEPAGYLLVRSCSSGETIHAEPFEACELRTGVIFGDEDDEP